MRRVISVFLPYWPTQRRCASREERKIGGSVTLPPDPTPFLLAQRHGSKRLIVAMDAKGQALGLRPGMAVAQVKATYPGLRIEEADPVGDAAGLNRLAAWCLRHISPIAAANPPDGLWIDVTGCAHLFNGEAALLNLLTQRLGEAGLTARAAIADTPGAAHALARHSKQTCVLSAPGHMRQDLASLPVSALRLPEETVLGLCRLGFESIGQLMATPRAPLAKRFGGDVLQKLDQALGQAPEPIKPMLEPEIPRTRAGFPEPICTPDHLARITTLLCERLCEKLLQRGLGALRLDLVFTRVDGIPQMVRIGTAAATRDAAHLARLLKEKIETIDPGFGIESALLAAPLTAALGAHQNVSELCTEQAVADFSTLIDTLANRLGGTKIFRLAPVESDVPERSVRRVPPLVRAEGVQWPKNLPRPPRLFTPPHPVTVLALLPDHAPKHFVWRRRPYRVRHADGPERIFGEWWRTDTEFSTVRDYFGVEDESGQRFWLFKHGDGVAPETGDLRWFLHGLL